MQKLPLDGVRVVDFTTAQAGAHMAQWLAVMGAEVIKVETRLRLDVTRQATVKDRFGHTDQSPDFTAFNSSKKSITLNMNHPKAKELVRRLIKISDVVTENFGGAVMDRWGLGYHELKKLREDIIYCAATGYGRTGPRKESPAYAPVVDAFSGLISVNGYEGGPPNVVGTRGWTDAMVAVHGAFVILVALWHRLETGEGQYIELAMTEENINSLGELVLDHSMNRRVTGPAGNSDSTMAPHGVYRCLGDDKWVAIAVSGDHEWNAFRNAIGNPAWTKGDQFNDHLRRQSNKRELDERVQEWTIQHTSSFVMETLQKAGIAAGACLDAGELAAEPHLDQRGFFIQVDDPTLGALRLPGLPWRLSEVPGGRYGAAPRLGEHNDYVFGELLGIPREKMLALEQEEVIY